MNVSYRWLTALAPELTDSPERVADRLAMYGAPVDEIVALGEPIADIVVARVESVRRHPNADRLSLCTVDAGTGESLQVVCGAPNVRAGGYYPFAPVGAALPGGITIRKARIRGEESRGMLCSERELGLGRNHEGILELHGDYTPGEPFAAALGLDDVRLVVDVTPNRPDLLSHWGVARELAPGGEAGLRLPPFPGRDGAGAAAVRFERVERAGEAGGVNVVLEDARGCPRYLGIVIRGVRIGPSPDWLAARLRAVGLRPINNVVDATNYVLYELGQPLHAFDLDRLGGGEVRIRRGRPGETIVTLDGERRVLTEEMVVIADAERPVAVAGVMGGEESEVSAETTNIFLECALFDPKTTRRTRRSLGLSTDASYRYERGVDPEGMERAARRAVELILAVAGGEVAGAGVDIDPEPASAPVVGLRPSRAAAVLGVALDADTLAGYLEPLGFRVVERAEDLLRVRVPGPRWYDVAREADLIEEVARRHGYDAFPETLRPFRPSAVPDDAMARLESRLREFLVGQGFLEARLASFAPESAGDVALLNPLSAEESRLRRALLPGLLRQVEQNFARAVRNVRLFEIGTVFAPGDAADAPPVEATHVAAVFTGARMQPHWSGEAPVYDAWDLKALLIGLGEVLGLGAAAVEPGEPQRGDVYAPALAFRVVGRDGAALGAGGRIDDRAIDAPAWAEPVWGLELTLPPVLATIDRPAYRPTPAFPAVERDAALLVPDALPAARVEAVIRGAGGAILEEVYPFDLYRGRGVAAGMRSIAYRMRFRAPDRTLTDREVDEAVGRILRRLEEELGVQRRG
ncbi:MAG TPA: phenylalanine--tRNA ligase subunit beta [Longimicrobiales bacterium]